MVKRLSLLMIIAILAIFPVVKNAGAATFSLNELALLELWEVAETPVEANSFLLAATNDPLVYGGGSMIGDVGYIGSLYCYPLNPLYPIAQMQIGANYSGANAGLGTSGATAAQVIGDSLGTAPTNSLLGFDAFTMSFGNDDDDRWMVSLYLNTGYTSQGEVDNFYQTGWLAMDPYLSGSLSLDLSGAANLDHVTNIGFMVKGEMDQIGDNPSNPDTFKISVSTIPEPTSLILLGAGLFGLVVVGRKRT